MVAASQIKVGNKREREKAEWLQMASGILPQDPAAGVISAFPTQTQMKFEKGFPQPLGPKGHKGQTWSERNHIQHDLHMVDWFSIFRSDFATGLKNPCSIVFDFDLFLRVQSQELKTHKRINTYKRMDLRGFLGLDIKTKQFQFKVKV